MVFSAVPFAFFSALLWGFSPIVSKKGMEAGGNPLQATFVVTLVATIGTWTLLTASGGLGHYLDVSFVAIGLFLFTGVASSGFGQLAMLTGIDNVGASVNTAVMRTHPLFATLLAIAWLHEPVTGTTIVGVVVLVAGVVVLSLSKGGDVRGWNTSDLTFPLLASFLFAIGNVVRRYGLDTTPLTPLNGLAINSAAGLLVIVLYVGSRRSVDVLRSPARSYAFFTGSGLLILTALLSLFEALSNGFVSVVDPIIGTTPLFTTVFTVLLLRDIERVTRGVWAGVVLIVAGIVLLFV